LVLNFDQVTVADVGLVGGKNASLGELRHALRRHGVRVPGGFALTAAAYWHLVDANGLREPITATLKQLDAGKIGLDAAGAKIRRMIVRAPFPPDLADAVGKSYAALCRTAGVPRLAVAVRSSATAEDLPDASFAGQHESYLHIQGRAAVLDAARRCIASLFNDRAISYRTKNGFDHMKIALSVGIQQMVRSDKAAAGVMFTLDTETGFPDAVRIEGSWGLGEMVVKGAVNPDSYIVFKALAADARRFPILERRCGDKTSKMIYALTPRAPTRIVATPPRDRARLVLSDQEIMQLARWAIAIEDHYGRRMDIEWAKDGVSGKLFVVQARPETVESRHADHALRTYRIRRRGKLLTTGLAIGQAIATGRVCKLTSPHNAARFPLGGVLVTKATDPDWVPVMQRASAIITEQGGRTSHAAIVSREFGLPAVIGTRNATAVLTNGQDVTVSCAEGDEGRVYDGIADYEAKVLNPRSVPSTRTKVMLNIANPASAMRWWPLPADGIGLARMEFIISNHIKIHPLALARFDQIKDFETRALIARMTSGYSDKSSYFVERLAEGVGRIAASQYPNPVIVRMSDFKTNEYAALIGGTTFEPKEENPMIGWRGASRYYSPDYRDGFALECRAIARVRGRMGFDNVIVMIPFCRTVDEADRVLAEMARHGLKRGRDKLEVYVMCEIPANVILAEDFAKRFDGFSIGSNDLTQLVLGVDRDSQRLAPLFKEDNPAVIASIRHVIAAAHKCGRKIGFCGQAPSDHPAYARLLVDARIDSVSVTPDSFINVKRQIAAAEGKSPRKRAVLRRA
jgi:pyruvate,water dikinase